MGDVGKDTDSVEPMEIVPSASPIDQVPAMMSPPQSTSVSTASFESFLRNTLLDLHVRSEVEACMQELVTDVEFGVNLQRELSIQTHQRQAERIIAEQELALTETHIVQKDRMNSQTLLADAMVVDLWTLSKELGSLLELKQKHETMIYEYDALVAKLAQAEEELRVARKQGQQPAGPVGATASVATLPAPATSASATIATVPETPTALAEHAKPENSEKSSAPSHTVARMPSQQENALTSAPAKTMEEPPEKLAAVEKPAPSPAPVVALVEDDQRVTLENIDMEILMRIFGFLDALDILNTAQLNISMYSRVDSLFGFGMDARNIPDDAASTSSTIATTPTMAATAGIPTTASVSTATTSATKKASPSAVVKGAPTQAASKSTTEPQFGQRLVGGGRNILSLLQGGARGDASTAGINASKRQRSPNRRGPGGGRGGGDVNDSKPPLSEAMAHSMAAKLNDAEINAIISMTEKLRSKEKQVALLIKEKEELEGKLSGSEAVKDFLITKVRDMEKIMNKSDETEKKVTQQIASDQEVIAFLDGRIQELERTTRIMQKEKNATLDKLKSVVAQNDKKVAVLSDMLQFERQKLKENEREWKATKKLLVKEVKGCRAQILALQAERDGFREQNDALRKAVMAGGSNNGGRSSSPHR